MGYFRHAIKYNSIGLFLTDSPTCSPTTSNIYYFNRVQSANFALDIARQDIQQIGGEDYLDRKIVSEANITLDFDYLLTDGNEERRLGFNIAPSGSGMPGGTMYSGLKEDKSAFLAIGEEPFDLTGYANRPNGYSGTDAMGVGNCFITKYSINASVGDFAKASVSMAASNVMYSCVGSGRGGHRWVDKVVDIGYLLLQINGGLVELQGGGLVALDGESGPIYAAGVPSPSLCLADSGIAPADKRAPLTYVDIDDEEITIQHPGTGFKFEPIIYKSPVAAIPPGGINLHINNINVGGPIISGHNAGTCTEGSANIQSFDITLPLAREDLRGFSSMHVYGRKMKYPQLGTLSMSLLSSAFESGNFKEIFCDDEIYNIEIDLNNQCDFACSPSNEHSGFMKFVINNAKLQGYSFSESIGSLATMNCSFTFGMSRKNGFFMSGSYT